MDSEVDAIIEGCKTDSPRIMSECDGFYYDCASRQFDLGCATKGIYPGSHADMQCLHYRPYRQALKAKRRAEQAPSEVTIVKGGKRESSGHTSTTKLIDQILK